MHLRLYDVDEFKEGQITEGKAVVQACMRDPNKVAKMERLLSKFRRLRAADNASPPPSRDSTEAQQLDIGWIDVRSRSVDATSPLLKKGQSSSERLLAKRSPPTSPRQ